MLLAILITNTFMPQSLGWFGYIVVIAVYALARQASAICLFHYFYKRLIKLMHDEHVK